MRLTVSCAVLAVLSASCGSTSGSFEPEERVLNEAVVIWANQLGLIQPDHEVWATRLKRACDEGVWDDEVAVRLATEFIEEDLPLSRRGGGSPPDPGEGAVALWLSAANACRDRFPPGEVDDGPPSPSGSGE